MHDLRSATITTLEIAEMMEIRHSDIVRRLEGRESKGKHIKGIIEILAERQMALSDFFAPSTYQDSSGKENKCYKCTRMGCEFLANKFTGEKGIIFTARYVKKFHEMEQAISKQCAVKKIPEKKGIPITPEEIVDWKLNDLHGRVTALEKEQSQKPKIGKLRRLKPKKDTWYEKNRTRIWKICYDQNIEIKELYHIILEECSRYYDVDSAFDNFRRESGRADIYPMDLVEEYRELQDIADQVLDYFER